MALKIQSLPSPNKYNGRSDVIKAIVIHWWDDPKNKPQFDNVVAHLRDPAAQVSAHYVVSGTKVAQLVAEKDTAWHARQANPFTIGIEVDPQTPGDTYKTVGKLVSEIRSRCGDIPLKRHSDYVATQCPGTLSLSKIEQLSKEDEMKYIDMPDGYKTYKEDITFIFDSIPEYFNYKNGWPKYQNWTRTALMRQIAESQYDKVQNLQKDLAAALDKPPEEVVKVVEKIVEKETAVNEQEVVGNFLKRAWNKIINFLFDWDGGKG